MEKPGKSRRRLKRVPRTGSRKFPKVYTLFDRLVGISHTGSLEGDRGIASVFMMPVSEKRRAWAEFDIPLTACDKQRGKNFERDFPELDSDSERPILASASMVLRPTFANDEKVPREVRKLAEGRKVASIHYGVNERFTGERKVFWPEPPSLVRKGIGEAMLRELEVRAKKEGVGLLFAHVKPGNEASKGLLKAHGYSQHPRDVSIWSHIGTDRVRLFYKKL